MHSELGDRNPADHERAGDGVEECKGVEDVVGDVVFAKP